MIWKSTKSIACCSPFYIFWNFGINKIDLIKNGLVQKNDLVKILSRGEITVKIDITANAFSNNAKLAIEKVGGSTNLEK